MKTVSTRSTFGHIDPTSLKTVDLPISSAAAGSLLELDVTGDLTVQLFFYASSEFYFAIAPDSATGHSRLGSDDSRMLLPAGFYTFPFGAEATNKVYMKSSGAAVTDGIRYHFVEED